MAINPFRLPVGQVSAGNFQPDNTKDGTINLRLSPYGSATYTGTLVGDGVYSFGSVNSGEYKVYNGGTELTSFGIVKIGEDGAVLITGNQTIAGVKTFTNQPVLNAGVQTDTISEKTSATGVTIDGILLKDNLNASNIVTVNTTQDVTGSKTFTATQIFSNTVTFQNDIGVSPIIFPRVVNASDFPQSPEHLTQKAYVDAVVSAVQVKPYQQATNVRRVQSGATTEAGKVYSTIAECISNFGTATATNRLMVILEKGQADSNYSNLFPLSQSTIDTKQFINIVGLSREGTMLVLGLTADNNDCTAQVRFENMTVFMTTTLSDRVLGSMEFYNCDLYCYKDVNFSNCIIKNCDIVHANGEIPILSGNGKCLNTSFSGSVLEDSYTGNASYTDGYDASPTMPPAPNFGS